MRKGIISEAIAQDNKSSFTISHDYIKPQSELGYHSHPEFELQYVSKGGGVHVIGGVSEPITRDELIIIPSNIPHVWFWDDKMCDENGRIEEFTLKFDMALLEDKFGKFPELEECVAFFRNLKYAVEIKGEASLLIKNALRQMPQQDSSRQLLSFLTILLELSSQTNYRVINDDDTQWVISKRNDKLDLVYHYVLDNYTRNISLDEVANVVGMNKHSFCNFFKRVTGKTFATMVNEYRINRATTMLYNDKLLTVNEICYSVGFSDPSYFNRVFHQFKGCSPTQYRKR